jgi:hypothetical protein
MMRYAHAQSNVIRIRSSSAQSRVNDNGKNPHSIGIFAMCENFRGKTFAVMMRLRRSRCARRGARAARACKRPLYTKLSGNTVIFFPLV